MESNWKHRNTGTLALVLVCFILLDFRGICAVRATNLLHYFQREKLLCSKNVDIQDFGIKFYDLKTNSSSFTLNHFYQNFNGDAISAWNVTSLNVVEYTKYIRYEFSVERGDWTSSADKFWTSDFVHRFGIQMLQEYSEGATAFFETKLASGGYFPKFWAVGGRSFFIGNSSRGCVEIHGMSFGKLQNYIAIATAFTKTFANHKLTIKPYYSKTVPDKLNLIVTDEFFFKHNSNHLTMKMVSGYFPDDNTYINYERINDKRYRFSCEGLFALPNTRIMLLPALGCEFVKGSGEDYRHNWYVQFGIRTAL